MKLANLSQKAFLLAVSICLLACTPEVDVEDLPEISPIRLSDRVLPAVREQIQSVQQAVMDNPMNASANGQLAIVLSAYGFSDAADIAYQRAILLEPRNVQWSYFRGHLLSVIGRHDEAIAQLAAALTINPEQKDAQLKLAELLSFDKPEQSRKLYEKVLRKYPNDVIALYGYANLLQGEGKAEEAIDLLVLATKQESKIGEIHYLLSTVYRRTGDEELAKRHRELFQRFQQNKLKAFDPVVRTLTQFNISDTRYMMAAQFHFQNGRYDDAIKALKAALAVNPDNAAAHIHLVWLFTHKNDHERASEHYRQAARIMPDDPQLLFNWAVANRRSGNLPLAREVLGKAKQVQPDNARIHIELGRLAMLEKNWAEAAGHYKKAVDIEPGRPEAQYGLGQALMQAGEYDRAQTHLEKLASLESPLQLLNMRALAQVYEVTGNMDAATKTLKRAQSLALKTSDKNLIAQIGADLERLAQSGDANQN